MNWPFFQDGIWREVSTICFNLNLVNYRGSLSIKNYLWLIMNCNYNYKL